MSALDNEAADGDDWLASPYYAHPKRGVAATANEPPRKDFAASGGTVEAGSASGNYAVNPAAAAAVSNSVGGVAAAAALRRFSCSAATPSVAGVKGLVATGAVGAAAAAAAAASAAAAAAAVTGRNSREINQFGDAVNVDEWLPSERQFCDAPTAADAARCGSGAPLFPGGTAASASSRRDRESAGALRAGAAGALLSGVAAAGAQTGGRKCAPRGQSAGGGTGEIGAGIGGDWGDAGVSLNARRSISGSGRRASLDYSDLEAVRERVQQAAALWALAEVREMEQGDDGTDNEEDGESNRNNTTSTSNSNESQRKQQQRYQEKVASQELKASDLPQQQQNQQLQLKSGLTSQSAASAKSGSQQRANGPSRSKGGARGGSLIRRWLHFGR